MKLLFHPPPFLIIIYSFSAICETSYLSYDTNRVGDRKYLIILHNPTPFSIIQPEFSLFIMSLYKTPGLFTPNCRGSVSLCTQPSTLSRSSMVTICLIRSKKDKVDKNNTQRLPALYHSPNRFTFHFSSYETDFLFSHKSDFLKQDPILRFHTSILNHIPSKRGQNETWNDITYTSSSHIMWFQIYIRPPHHTDYTFYDASVLIHNNSPLIKMDCAILWIQYCSSFRK